MWLMPLLTPAVYVFFRPEEQNSFSGKDNIAPPVFRRDGEMHHAVPEQLPITNLQSHCLVAASTGCYHLRILLQHGRNAQCVPDAVSPPALCSYPNAERCWNSRKWFCHQNFPALL